MKTKYEMLISRTTKKLVLHFLQLMQILLLYNWAIYYITSSYTEKKKNANSNKFNICFIL